MKKKTLKGPLTKKKTIVKKDKSKSLPRKSSLTTLKTKKIELKKTKNVTKKTTKKKLENKVKKPQIKKIVLANKEKIKTKEKSNLIVKRKKSQTSLQKKTTSKKPLLKKKLKLTKKLEPINKVRKKQLSTLSNSKPKKKSSLKKTIKSKSEKGKVKKNLVSKSVTGTSTEHSIIKKSAQLTKNISSQVTLASQLKAELETKISQLQTRVLTLQAVKNKNPSLNQILVSLKEELIKELFPLLKNISLKQTSKNTLSQIEELLNIEIKKVKTEQHSNHFEMKKEVEHFCKAFEKKILLLFQDQNLQKFKLENVSLQLPSKITSLVNKKVDKKMLELQQEIKGFSKENQNQKKELSQLKKTIKTLLCEENVSLDDIFSKISEIEKSNKQIEQRIFEYKKQANQKQDRKKKGIENLTCAHNNFVAHIKEEHEQLKCTAQNSYNLVAKEVQDIFSHLKMFEKKLSFLEKNMQSSQHSSSFKKELDSLKEFKEKVASQLAHFTQTTDQQHKQHAFKLQNYIKALDMKVKNLEIKHTSLFESNYNKQSKALQVSLQKNISKEVKAVCQSLSLLQRETVAKEIVALNTEFKLLVESNKDEMLDFKAQIGSLGSKLTSELEEEFKNSLETFNRELKEKESCFLTKLLALEEERSNSTLELENFKKEIAELTKDYISKAHKELETFKQQEYSLKEETKQSISQIETIAINKKEELIVYLESQKIKDEGQLEMFKTSFSQKAHNLHTFLDTKLNSIEKKFVEKNIKNVKEDLQPHFESIELLSQTLKSKAEVIDTRIEDVETKERDFFENLQAEQNRAQEKVENRLMELEKQLNKRFLDFEVGFSNFKRVVVDEVEGVIKDTKLLIDEKIQQIDSSLSNSQFTFKNNTLPKERIETQIENLKREICDLQVKFEISEPSFKEGFDMNEYVHLMASYEEQLTSLISSLKNRGLDNTHIEQVLFSKGHPKFYVKAVLRDFDEISSPF